MYINMYNIITMVIISKIEHKIKLFSFVIDFMPIRKRNSETISVKKATESVIPPAKISKYNC